MASEETKNGDKLPTSTSPRQGYENIESDSTQNEMDKSACIVDNVTGHGAVIVHNPMLQPCPSGFQDYHIYRTAAGQQFPANQNIGVQTAEGHMLPERIGFQLADQAIPVARGSGAAQVFNVPTEPSQRRHAVLHSPFFCPSLITRPSLITHPVQQTTLPHTRPSILESIQAAPFPAPLVRTAPFPPQAQTAAFFHPLSRTTAPVLTSRPLSPSAKEFFPHHILQGNFGQYQTRAPIQPPSRLTSPAYAFGPVMPVARGSGLAQASNAPVLPSHKRSASQISPVTRPVQRRNISRERPKRASISQSVQATPSLRPRSQVASVPPQARTATALSHLPRTTARSFSALDTLACLAKNFPTDHTLQDFNKPPQPGGRECFFCKRDLSFTPEAEGPISQPTVPPSVAVLSCGHYFHAQCLEIVTPDDQSTDPPCILCSLGEKS